MWPLLLPVLISLGTAILNKIEPKLGELLMAIIDAWISNLKASGIPPDEIHDVLWPTAKFIALGIYLAHPDWPATKCATWSRDAIHHMLVQHQRDPNDPAVAWLADSAINVVAAAHRMPVE